LNQEKTKAALHALVMIAGCTVGLNVWAQQQSVAPLADGVRWNLNVSPLTLHWHPDPAHKPSVLLGLERLQADGALWGGLIFTNSFGQPSGYVYYGHVWEGLFGQPKLYGKLTGGILYGYTGIHKDDVPFNHGGFAPAIVPAVGWRLTSSDAAEVEILGSAALAFVYSRRF